MYCANVTQFISIRTIEPQIPIEVLRKIWEYFPIPKGQLDLDPSFEDTNSPDIKHEYVEPFADVENVKKFKHLQKMESVGLLRPVGEEHMYFAAMHSKKCELTPLGQHYWRLVKAGRI